MRLHELAKKLGFNQQDLLTAVQKEGFDVKNTLMVVDPGIEAWVTQQAASGWIPPPPEKKTLKRKKIVLVKPSAAGKTAEGGEAGAESKPEPARGADADHTPETTADDDAAGEKPEPKPTIVRIARKKTRDAAEAAKTDAIAEPESPETGDDPKDNQPSVPSAPAQPPVVVKRVNTTVKGTAVVGQASPETIAAIKRNAQTGARGGRPDRSGPPERQQAGIRRKPAGIASAQVEPVMPDTDLSGKTRVKQRIKTRVRGVDNDEQEALEKKTKAAKRGGRDKRGGDWGLDEEFADDSYYEEGGEAPVEDSASNTSAIESINSDLITSGGDETERTGFKHKRADFKSKRIQHELPASFAEIDNEFTRTLSGGGRRRGGRGATRRHTGRRSRTRRIAGPVQRVPGQAAVAYLGMTLRDLSVALGVKMQEILGWLLGAGKVMQVNDILTEDDITSIAERFKIELEWETEEDLERELAAEAEHQTQSADDAHRAERPPVVTFMGHVDHGKTSLLDCIRHTRVVDGEHGGITQHIGAYSVAHNGKRITFLDTPGHEAFSAMRARGANLTDIAVLVVAADDGVMPQTEEAAAHAKNAGVPVVVAINKCDLPSANPDRVRQELANRLGLLPEEWGGQVGMIEVSAITQKGINELLERILLESEVLELRANSRRPATGFVVEAKMSEGQGVLSTMLVSDGTLRNGDVILCSNGYGKIRFMLDEFGKSIVQAGPGAPVRVSGLSAVPEAGDAFFILPDLAKARAIAEQRERETRAAALARRRHVTLENLTAHLVGSGRRELSVIVKADVVGSLEVIEKTLRDLATDEVGISIIHSAIGGVNHADVILADASDAIILGFHVGVEAQAKSATVNLGVQIRTYHIIYRMIEDMRAALEGLLPPEEKEVVQGHVEIRQVFRASKIGAIAGCYVTDGLIQRTSRIRLYRNQVVIYDGTIQSLKRIKDDAREVKSGFECGIKIANYDGIAEGDIIEAYAIEEIARKL